MKKIKNIFLAVLVMVLSALSVYAADIDWEHFWDGEETLDMVDLDIVLDAPEGFNERVEIFLDKYECAMVPGSGYEINVPFEKREYSVVVLSSTDSLDYYVFQYPETIDLSKTKVLNIRAIKNPEYEISDEGAFTIDENFSLEDVFANIYDEDYEYPDDEADFFDIDDEYYIDDDPEEYDFSEGEEYGIINITCRNYPCFASATYTLVGNGHMYEITLHLDYDFTASVKLPVGSYYESVDFDYEYNGFVEGLTDKVDFMWRHSTNLSSYGNYYHVEAGETTEISDLVIYMSYDGDIAEVDTNILVAPSVYNEQLQMQEDAYLAKLQEAFPDDYYDESESEPENIAVVDATVTVNEENHTGVIIIITVIAVLVCILGSVAYIRHRRE